MPLLSTRRALSAFLTIGLLSCIDGPTAPIIPGGERVAALSATRPPVVISQVYGAGGNTGASWNADYVELFNTTGATVNITGWKVQYTSAGGNTWSSNSFTLPAATIGAGRYYLIRMSSAGSTGSALPTPDAGTTTSINMSGSSGKVILTTGANGSGNCPTGADIMDAVGFGTSTNCTAAADWNGATVNLTATTAATRNSDGCAYTANLTADFTAATAAPRNSATAANICPAVPLPPVSVTVTPATRSIPVGTTQNFTAQAFDGATPPKPTSTTFTWSSDNTAVATVNASGVATAVAVGTATISARSANNVVGTATLTVTPPLVVDIVISQVYGGGGNSGAQYTNDYVELYNRGADPVDLTGWTVQYSSATSTSWSTSGVTTLASGSIAPGKYYLVQLGAGTGVAASLPTPDATGTTNMSGIAGKVLLALPGITPTGACPSGTGIVDRLNYGSTANCTADWGGATGNLSNTTAAFRKNDGCIKTGSSANDFIVLLPNPHNSASPTKSCGGGAPRTPSSASIAISELMGDPANAENASWGEWFEVYNYGTTPVDLNGWTIVTGGTSQPDHHIGSSVVVPAGGRVVLGRGNDVTRNGGITLDYNYFTGQATTIWLDDSDYLALLDPAGALADSVIWTSLPHGVTRALRDVAQPRANVDGTNWGYSTTTFGDGDYGTPRAVNTALADVAPVVSAYRITLSGRTTTTGDIAVPVGFEAQEFASEATDAGVPITTTFTWTSLTPALASIDQNGVMHALAAGTARFQVTATDGATRTFSIPTYDPVASSATYRNNIAFGELTAGVTEANDYRISRREYTSSYNGSRGIPNWVAYNLNGTQMVSGQDRCNCFTFDPELIEAGFAAYTTADYTGAGGFAGFGIDRGHMTRSFDRTAGSLDNAHTFYFSNVVPQFADLNQGPWAHMEDSLGYLAQHGKEVYIYVGPAGRNTTTTPLSNGTVKNEGKIVIPAWTWKVAAILPAGKGPADIHDYRDLSVIAVVMPNIPGVRNVDWTTNYVVTVDSVEKLTGYRFFTGLSARDQRALKTNIQPPIGAVDGPYSTIRGNALSLSAATSVDPNGTITSYAWTFGDGGVATGATATHTYLTTGSFDVRLIVTDNDGLADTVLTTTTVGPRSPACGIGRFENEANAFACEPAPAGTYVDVPNASAATPCAAGTYQPAVGQASCLLAPAGSYVDVIGATSANLCAAGTFQPATGATSCQLAPAGTYVATNGAASATPCAAGFYQPATGATSCIAAAAGSYVDVAGAISAIPCAAGTFQPATGAMSCDLAPAGSYVATTGAAAATPCSAGTYQPLTGQSSCVAAPAGSYVNLTGAVSASPCSPGTFQPAIGATSCDIAPAGTYVAAAGAMAATPCAVGYYQPAAGAASCLAAPIGSYVDVVGATASVPCPVGMTTNATGTASLSGCVWLPPAVLAQQAGDALQQLVTNGSLSSRDAGPIQVSIDQALSSIGRGNPLAARNQLDAARNKVSAAVNSGRLTAAQAADLLAALDRAMAHTGV